MNRHGRKSSTTNPNSVQFTVTCTPKPAAELLSARRCSTKAPPKRPGTGDWISIANALSLSNQLHAEFNTGATNSWQPTPTPARTQYSSTKIRHDFFENRNQPVAVRDLVDWRRTRKAGEVFGRAQQDNGSFKRLLNWLLTGVLEASCSLCCWWKPHQRKWRCGLVTQLGCWNWRSGNTV